MANRTIEEESVLHEHSPGVIQNQEKVFRILYKSMHFKNNKILSTWFKFDELKDRGSSINRDMYNGLFYACKEARSKINSENLEKNSADIMETITEKIRVLANENKRVFVVIDTAKAEDISHGDIFLL